MNDIIRLSQEHIAECSELFVRVFNGEPWNDHWTVETVRQRLSDIYETPNFEGVVYREDGRIKGAILGNCEQFYNGIHFSLKEMFVSTEEQGRGIGSKLLRELEERLKASGVTTVYLFTLKNPKTLQFYQRNGFSESDIMVLMGKDL